MRRSPDLGHEGRPPVRLLIVDGHVMVGRGIASGLSRFQDLEVVATAQSLVEGVALSHEFAPDVVLLDYGTVDDDLSGAIRSLRGGSGTTVLVLAGQVTGLVAADSIAAGASGALEKTQDLVALAVAIRSSARGEKMIVDKRLLPDVLRNLRGTPRSSLVHLTPREREVLTLLDQGLDAARIGAQLGIARNTARNYVQNVLVKFDAHSRLEAVARARREGFLPP
jgi:DNA-binding NarL/FixJ family response regulator